MAASLFDLLQQFAALGPRTQQDIGCRLACTDQALAYPYIFVEQGQRGLERFDGANGTGVAEPGLLDVGGELSHGALPGSAGEVALRPGRRTRAEQRVVEQRLYELEFCFLTEREGGVHIGRKARFTDELVECRVGRVDEVTDVHDTVELGVARVQANRGEEPPVGLAHAGVGAGERRRLLGEGEVRRERFGHVAIEELPGGGWLLRIGDRSGSRTEHGGSHSEEPAPDFEQRSCVVHR